MRKVLTLLVVAILGLNPMTTLFGQQQNFLTASGNKLYDSTGKEVRLTGVNWFGFETSLYSPHGIWSRDMKSVLQQIKDMGFNTIRVPWCNEMLNPGASVNINSYGTDAYSGVSPMNEEEATVSTPIELMDIFVRWCQENDMKIVLDNHSRAADGFLNEEVWYTDEYSEERWINDWLFLADRYKEYSAVVAMDLNNEPHGSTWGDSNPATDWNKAAERCGNAILEVNPDVLIMVEGVGEFEGDTWWWGGQLKGAGQYPVVLSDPSKLIYSAHEYGPEVAQQDWFEAPNFPENMPALWEEHYHYLYESNTSPILIGEFGIRNQNAYGGIAYTWFTEYMDFMGDIYSWTFWTMNPNSGDTGGILQDDWTSVNQWKLDVLQPHVAPLIPNVIGDETGNLPPVARLTSSDTSGDAPLTVSFSASTSSDPDGDSLTYSWNFGDGSATVTGETATHTFVDFGDYLVVLTVSDGELSDTETVTISVDDGEGPAPVTAVISSEIINEVAPATVIFDGSGSSSEDGSSLTYVWDLGDNNSAIGEVVSHIYTEEGEYNVTLTVSNGDSTDTETTTIVVLPNDSTGDCSFGAPLSTSLESINRSFNYSYTLGTGGPDLSNVTSFVINWDLQNNGLWQFSMNTNNGQPSWWNDLKTNITSQNFNSASPAVTLSGTGFPNLDGSYYVAIDGSNFVMVSIDSAFTLYFSNQTTEPACSDESKSSTLTAGLLAKALSNPATSKFEIEVLSSEVTDMTLYSITGRKLLSVAPEALKTRIVTFGEELSTGIYMLKVLQGKESQTLKLVKE
ncbi:cellulase family glycosylhydrolase [Aquimarina pacifica]|uniref:cellulase family glycosylhydrolase n=1 Tax=Aquimarina pacifica TaxID=1296415 RepID=UPI00046E66E2|nr:cellulase family glycosylhydrolase [Aquimarina pacifica]